MMQSTGRESRMRADEEKYMQKRVKNDSKTENVKIPGRNGNRDIWE